MAQEAVVEGAVVGRRALHGMRVAGEAAAEEPSSSFPLLFSRQPRRLRLELAEQKGMVEAQVQERMELLVAIPLLDHFSQDMAAVLVMATQRLAQEMVVAAAVALRL